MQGKQCFHAFCAHLHPPALIGSPLQVMAALAAREAGIPHIQALLHQSLLQVVLGIKRSVIKQKGRQAVKE